MPGGITFDSNNLQTANILTQDIDHASANKSFALSELGLADKSTIPHISYPDRTVSIRGTLLDSSIPLVDAQVDTFQSYFTGQEKNLDIEYASGTRRYIATAKSVKISRPGGLLFAQFQVDFACTEPFGMNTTDTTIASLTGQTAGSITANHTYIGTAPWQKPVITITFSAMTGNTTAKNVVLSAGSTGQAITINRIWAATDVLVVDVYNKTVKVNGVDVAFSGAFPEFAPGNQDLVYTDTLTTRTLALSATYKALYL